MRVHGLRRELLHKRSGAASELLAKGAILNQTLERSRKMLASAVHEQPVFPIPDEPVHAGAVCEPDSRQTHRHGFGKCQSPPFVERRNDEDVRLQHLANGIGGEAAQQNVSLQTLPANLLLELRLIGAFPIDMELPTEMPDLRPVEGIYQDVKALLRHEAANSDNSLVRARGDQPVAGLNWNSIRYHHRLPLDELWHLANKVGQKKMNCASKLQAL